MKQTREKGLAGLETRWGPESLRCIVLSHLLVAAALLVASRFIATHTPLPHEVCCDVLRYVRVAQSIEQNGLWARHPDADLRLYLFPYLLSLDGTISHGTISRQPHLDQMQELPFAKYIEAYSSGIISRYALVALACWLILILSHTPTRLLLWISFLANPLLLSYLPIPLSESYTLLFFAVLLCVLVSFLNSQVSTLTTPPSHMRRWLLVAFLGLLSGGLVMMRPASIAIAVSVFTTLWFYLSGRSDLTQIPSRRRRALSRLMLSASVVLVFGSGFAVAVAPQVVLNLKHFDRASFLPNRDLGNAQLLWGLANFKYATLMDTKLLSEGHSRRLYYPTRDYVPRLKPYRDDPLAFYREHPLRGIGLFLVHVYQSLNYDFWQVYVNQPYYPIVSWHQLLSSFVTIAGFLGIACRVRHFDQQVVRRPEVFFLLACLVSNSLLVGLTAVETRFGMISTGALSYFAVHFCRYDFVRTTRRRKIAGILVVAGYMVASAALSLWFVRLTGKFAIVWAGVPS